MRDLITQGLLIVDFETRLRWIFDALDAGSVLRVEDGYPNLEGSVFVSVFGSPSSSPRPPLPFLLRRPGGIYMKCVAMAFDLNSAPTPAPPRPVAATQQQQATIASA